MYFTFSCLHQGLSSRKWGMHCKEEDQSGPQIFGPPVQSSITVPREPTRQSTAGKADLGLPACKTITLPVTCNPSWRATARAGPLGT